MYERGAGSCKKGEGEGHQSRISRKSSMKLIAASDGTGVTGPVRGYQFRKCVTYGEYVR